jgi:hypothetical protein
MSHLKSPWRTLLFSFLVLSLVAGAWPAAAFFQKTTVEGTVGKDIGGVWLAVHHLMPMFRVRLDRGAERVAPFDVGPIGADNAALFGGAAQGVVITKMADPTISAAIGVFEGDVITKVNTTKVVDVESYEKALAKVESWFLVTIRRTALSYTSAKIVKIEYSARQGELEDGTTGIAEETINIQMSDSVLPFHDDVEKTRETHVLFTPGEEAVKTLAADWWKLPAPSRATFISGEHRLVAERNYDSALRQDENLDGTSFALISTLQGNPLAGSGGKTIAVYGARETTAQKMSGTYIETTLAQAPFPISIEFAGGFTMTRLDDFSNKDGEYRLQQAAKEKKELETEDVELAPDIPKVLPEKEENPPAVAD